MVLKKLTLMIACFFALLTLKAENDIITKTSHDGKYSYTMVKNDPLNARFYTLENGLTVMLAVNKTTPRIQTLVPVKAGSKHDPAHNTGLAHYLEHMLFKGTDKFGTIDYESEKKYLDQIDALYEKYNQTKDETKRFEIYKEIDSISNIAARYAIPNEYDRLMSEIGGRRINAFTSTEQTVYMSDIPANQVDNWLKIESERYRKPVMRLFHTELETVYEEKNMSLDNDSRKVFDAALEALFKNHAIGTQTTLGSVEHLRNPSLVEIRKFYDKYYVPNNMGIVMVGDFDPDELIVKIDERFGYMEAAEVPVYTYDEEEPMNKPATRTVVGPDAENVLIAYRLPGAHYEDAIMLDVIASLLSNRRAGLIDINLNQQQRVLEASSGKWAMNDYSILILSGRPRSEQNLEDVSKLLLEQVEKIKNGEFDEEMLEAIINNLKVQRIRTHQDNSGIAFALSGNFILGKNWDEYVSYPEQMSRVTKEDVVAYANKHLNNNYVKVFKKEGTDTSIEKVVQPAITPIEVNRDAKSDFFKKVAGRETVEIEPLFLDYNKDIKKSNLRKGIDIYHVNNTENELFNLYYVFDLGRLHDKELAHAVSYLTYLGTDKFTPEELSREFYRLACNFNVSAGADRLYVSLSGLNSNFEEALALFEHLLANAKADEEAYQNMIDGIVRSRADNKLNKSTILWSAMRNYATYGAENPYTYLLSEEKMRAMNPNELVKRIHQLTEFKHDVYYYGPLETKTLAKTLKKHHKTPRKLKELPPKVEFNRLKQEEPLVYFVNYDMVQTDILWLRKSQEFNPELLAVSNLFNEYFGGGMSSVVFQQIRESQALAYSTFSRFMVPGDKEDPFYILAFVGTQHDKMLQAIESMNALLNDVPVSESALANAKNAIRQNLASDRIIRERILFDYQAAVRRGMDYDMRKDIFNSLDEISMEDILNFHEANYKGKSFVYCVVGDKNNIDMKSLSQFGKVVELELEDIFGY